MWQALESEPGQIQKGHTDRMRPPTPLLPPHPHSVPPHELAPLKGWDLKQIV